MKLIDGPQNHPTIQKIQWITNPLGYMENCHRKYGDVFAAKIGVAGRPVVFVSHPQAIQEILTRDTKEFTAPGSSNRILEPVVGDKSVILLDDKNHLRQRKLLMPPFHGERMFNYGKLICDLTTKIGDTLPIGKTFLARDYVQKISLAIILQAVFGVYEGPRYDRLKKLTTELVAVTDSPIRASILFFPILQQDLGRWSPWGRFQGLRRDIDKLLLEEIEERRQNPDPNRTDILNLMMSARDENGEQMTYEELRDELLTLLFAGHETTATAMAWSLYWVHKLPTVRDRLLSELATLPPNPDPMTIYRLPYLTAICQETLRIYPVAMVTFPRVTTQAVELMGYHIEPNIEVIGAIYLTHNDPTIYPDPKQFKPERFLDKKYSPYQYLPFGGGARQCIGMALAQYELKLVLATVMLNYQLTLANSQPAKAARRGVTLSATGGIPMVLTGRRSLSSNPVGVAPKETPLLG
ncbi:MAG: cytochrome P450 [Limnospira sp. PMC 1291.21]|uniref:Cytochrome P450 110 n=3 Tax=Limnospira TaxID=2596745 RepID=A0A9P1P164_9CYAN|nr:MULTISPECIES: cytochrome P450 [Limnospira]EKD09385.1 cytochrome P450 [Arthrospira platensis C1]MBD2668208.1 cytochrome P450 [Arthrospira platensis FACHB-439]MDC0836843.1 cytochrome P450 [Limnoraphis robusta]MDY7053196.1 cytochrome P450 [Limnospira fusiformis LS22]QJB24748.1 cytochrome P450 [Limnospira fusiformis SAG 85.79]